MAITGTANALGQFGNDIATAKFGLEDRRRQAELDRMQAISDAVRLQQLAKKAAAGGVKKPRGPVFQWKDGDWYQEYTMPDGSSTFEKMPVGPVTGKEKEAVQLGKLGATPEQVQHSVMPARAFKTQDWRIEPSFGLPIRAINRVTGQMVTPDNPFLPEDVRAAFEAQTKAADITRSEKPDVLQFADIVGTMPPPGGVNEKKYDLPKYAEELRKAHLDFTKTITKARGEGFNFSKRFDAFDTWNRNKPISVTFETYLKNPGRYLPQGKTDKYLSQTAQIVDLIQQSGKMQDDVKALVGPDGASGWNATLRENMLHYWEEPTVTGELFYQRWSREALTKTQRNLLTDLANLKEATQGLRTMAGAGGATNQVRAIAIALLPSASTPDADYALEQLEKLDGLVYRLKRGIPDVPLPPLEGAEGDKERAAQKTSRKKSSSNQSDGPPPGAIIIDWDTGKEVKK